MRSVIKNRSAVNATNLKKLEELCEWISADPDQILGWTQLCHKSGFTKEQLIEIFQLFKQTTPMSFVRNVRLHHKRNHLTDGQPELFDNTQKTNRDYGQLI